MRRCIYCSRQRMGARLRGVEWADMPLIAPVSFWPACLQQIRGGRLNSSCRRLSLALTHAEQRLQRMGVHAQGRRTLPWITQIVIIGLEGAQWGDGGRRPKIIERRQRRRGIVPIFRERAAA